MLQLKQEHNIALLGKTAFGVKRDDYPSAAFWQCLERYFADRLNRGLPPPEHGDPLWYAYEARRIANKACWTLPISSQLVTLITRAVDRARCCPEQRCATAFTLDLCVSNVAP